MAGEAPSPNPIRMCMSPKSRSHSGRPSMSKQYSPAEPKKEHSTSPSVTAEGEAQLPVRCLPSCGAASRTTRSQAISPVRRSTASSMYRSDCDGDSVPTKRLVRRVNRPSRVPLSPAGTAVDTNTWSPQTIGVAEPLPGIAIFHLTLRVSLHSTGGSAAGASPVASGPRHCGHALSSAAASSALEVAAGSSAASIQITTIRHPCTRIDNPCLMPIPNRLHAAGRLVDAATRIVDHLAEF